MTIKGKLQIKGKPVLNEQGFHVLTDQYLIKITHGDNITLSKGFRDNSVVIGGIFEDEVKPSLKSNAINQSHSGAVQLNTINLENFANVIVVREAPLALICK